MSVAVKICGLKTPEAVAAAVRSGADMVGFVFFPRSPRNVAPEDAAVLATLVPDDVVRTGLFVDPDDRLLADVLRTVPLDLIQLHGGETPKRCRAIRARFRLHVMKAFGIASAADVVAARAFEPVCDRLLFDARPVPGTGRPGGNAQAFDWGLLDGTAWAVPWMLAGGLTPENVGEAIAVSGAPGVDVSSGVEDAPGIKNEAKIRAFLDAARRAG